MPTKTAKRKATAKADNGNPIHLGQTLYNGLGMEGKVVDIDDDGSGITIQVLGTGEKQHVPMTKVNSHDQDVFTGHADDNVLDALGDDSDEL